MEQQQQWQPPRYEGRGARLRDEHHATLKRRKEAVASWAAGVAEDEHNPVYADDIAPIGPQRYTNALEPQARRRRTMSDAQERPASSESEAAPAVTAMEAETAALAEAASATNAGCSAPWRSGAAAAAAAHCGRGRRRGDGVGRCTGAGCGARSDGGGGGAGCGGAAGGRSGVANRKNGYIFLKIETHTTSCNDLTLLRGPHPAVQKGGLPVRGARGGDSSPLERAF